MLKILNLISLPKKNSRKCFVISFPTTILELISKKYEIKCPFYNDYHTKEVSLTEEELKLFELICYEYYKTYGDSLLEYSIHVDNSFVIPSISNMKKFLSQIQLKDNEKVAIVIEQLLNSKKFKFDQDTETLLKIFGQTQFIIEFFVNVKYVSTSLK